MYKKLDEVLEIYDGVLLTSAHNLRYFTNFTGGEGAAVFTKGERVLFTDSRYIEQAQNEAKGFAVIESSDWMKSVGEFAGETGLSTVLFEDDELSTGGYMRLSELLEGCELVFGAAKLREMRMIKTEEEISKIRCAEEIGCEAFHHILSYIKPGVREMDIALEIEYYMRKRGATGTSFDTIAISGKRTSLPHGIPTDKKVEPGDFVTLDFGCVYEGYCSDMTRTVVVGKANSEQKKIYEIVRRAQQIGLDSIKEEALCCDVDKVAREYIEGEGYGEYFRHSLGHGVGLLVHELPNLSPRSEAVLKENMVVSCEPGIYIPNFGGVRIEDLVRVTKEGCEILSPVTKELIEL